MAGPSPERFQRALTSFKGSLSNRCPELLNQFSFGNLHDLQTACHDIQNEMGQSRCLRRMRRIKGFIEAMEQLGQSIEIFVNANDLVCFIWVAKTHVESFDKLLDVYEKVGSVIPGLLAYRSMLEKHPPLATVLEDYYSDILRFHEAALKVFVRPTWKKLFKAAWKTFDAEFQPLLQSLANRRDLLESEKGSASLYEISKAREEMAARHEAKKHELRQNEIEKHKWRLLQIRAHFEAGDYQNDQEIASEARHADDDGDWLLQSQDFKQWVNGTATRHSVLYIHGIPGAGKTTLISSVIAKLLEDNSNINDSSPTLVLYFYVKHKQPRRTTHNDLLRAMIEQIVSRDRIICDHLFDKLASVEGMQLRSTKFLESLIATALETYQRSFIVLDGLDEAASEEAEKSVTWLLSLVNGGIREPTASLKVLISGRRDGILDNLLSEQPSIALDSMPEHNTDILKYCQHMSAKIRRQLDITPTLEDEIISKVAGQANGMFLYARVVLENLLGQIRLGDLKRELQPDIFPKEIDQAYERVAVRVLEEAPPVARQCASKILGWVTCAARPLYWREIQSIFCIDVESGTVEYEDRRLRISCKQLCGSLVDVHPVPHGQRGADNIVTIVHGSARKYLVQKQWINIALEHAKAATFCFLYLTSKPFRGSTVEISQDVRQGYYGFLDYAVQHCLDHFESCTGLEPHTDILQQTMEAARDFLTTYSLSIAQNVSELSHDDLATFISGLPKDKRERASTLSIGYRTLDIRRVIEQMRAQGLPPEDEALLSSVYGKRVTYKCPKIWCHYFSMGFDNTEDRQKHVDGHDRPFRCPQEGCFAFQLGCSSKDKLEQHMMKYHGAADDEIRFPKKPRPRENDTLIEAVGRNDLAAIKVFLESGFDVDGSSDTRKKPANRIPLCRAAKNGHVEACELLLEWGAASPINIFGSTSPLYHAIENNHPEVVHCLLSRDNLGIEASDLARYVHQACIHAQLDTLRIISGWPHFIMISEVGGWWWYVSSWIRAACSERPDNPERVEIVKHLAEQGFLDRVPSDVLSYAKYRGWGHLESLLGPMSDIRASSEEQAEEQAGNLADERRGGSNHALQDYQERLMLLEQQDKERLMMERQPESTTDPHASSVVQVEEKKGFGPNEHPGGGNHALQDFEMQLHLLQQQDKKREMMARQEKE